GEPDFSGRRPDDLLEPGEHGAGTDDGAAQPGRRPVMDRVEGAARGPGGVFVAGDAWRRDGRAAVRARRDEAVRTDHVRGVRVAVAGSVKGGGRLVSAVAGESARDR